jgi:heme exporter protein CcmD
MFEYGRYTPYVLSAYGIAAIVLVALVVGSILRVISAKKKLDAIEGASGKDETT